ncbi:MAG: SoxR reducing system RseC family protein [Prevotella sp.]|nr:SoxR reducing system RseC family protein [Prevotella sp.]
MDNSIRHEGKVESIEGRHIRVKIVQNSACSACKVASHCNASESKEKVIDVFGAPSRSLQVGDEVVVSTSGKTAGRALMLGFGLPLVLMLAILVLMLAIGQNEGIAALSAVAVLVPYYFVIWLVRDRIASTVSFTIE